MTTDALVFFAGSIYLIMAIAYFILVACTWKLAERNGRMMAGWTTFAIFFTPLLAILLLHCLGKTEEGLLNEFYRQKQWETDYNNGTKIKL